MFKNIFSAIILLTSGFLIGVYSSKKGVPFIKKKNFRFSIGIYCGESPFNLAPSQDVRNPVLTANDVSDIQAEFVADPFMVYESGKWHMFFEVMNKKTKKGEIGLASSNDALHWEYRRIVLDEPFHLSYPYVFAWEGEYYMIPESNKVKEIRLYKATRFPEEWSYFRTLLKGDFIDTSVFYFDNIWWMFAGMNPICNDILCLYYADTLFGPWHEHPKSPIIRGDAKIARPGGRIINIGGSPVRFAQDDYPIFGSRVHAFLIRDISVTTYEESRVMELSMLKASGTGWNQKGMHHVDLHVMDGGKWIACVDGYRKDKVLSFKRI